MTKWKQRRIEREKQRREFALVAQRVFLQLYCDKTYNIKMDAKQAVAARQSMCEAAWNMADFMLDAKAGNV